MGCVVRGEQGDGGGLSLAMSTAPTAEAIRARKKRPMKHWTPSFGEFVTNPHASVGNPQKHGYFVEIIQRSGRVNPGTWYRCTDGNGKFWECSEVVRFAIKLAGRLSG